MSKTKLDVSHVAQLANLPLRTEEIRKLESQLDETLDYIKKLNEVETGDIEPTSQVTGLENVTRADEAKESLTQEEALSNSKNTYNGLFKVKAILDND